jgi:uncharacterized protein YkwD
LHSWNRPNILQAEGHASLSGGTEVSHRQRLILQMSALALIFFALAGLGKTSRADTPIARPISAYAQGVEEKLAWVDADAGPSGRMLTAVELQDLGSEVIALTNQQRALYGLPPLTANSALTSAAAVHSNDMADNNFFSHTGSDGSNPGQRISRAGYSYYTYGENIAAGYT